MESPHCDSGKPPLQFFTTTETLDPTFARHEKEISLMPGQGFLSAKQIMARNASLTNSEPAAPKDLTPAAKKEWKRITGLLRERKCLAAIDQAGLHDYLVCWQRLQECEADIADRGVLVKGDRGSVKNPSLQIARQYREHMLAWSKEFGFTIGSRSRLAVPDPEPPQVNKFAFLDGGLNGDHGD